MKTLDVKHVWFDFAGTLYRETPKFKQAHDQLRYVTYAKVAGEHDMDKAMREYDALYAKHGSNAAAFTSLGKPNNYWQQVYDELDSTNLLDPDPQVASALAEIKQRLPVSLFSNFRIDQIRRLLAHLQIPLEYFTCILTGDDVPVRKPALGGFKKMVELSRLRPADILYVGDRVSVDIRPAKVVGMKTCLIYGKSDEADLNVSSFEELSKLI